MLCMCDGSHFINECHVMLEYSKGYLATKTITGIQWKSSLKCKAYVF